MTLKLIGYLIWLPALLGLGSAIFLWISRFIAIEPDFANLIIFISAGLAVLGVVSDILNFFTAIAPPIPLLMVIIGWILFIFNRKRIRAALYPADNPLSARIVILAVVLLLFTAYYTQRGFIQGDVPWYHFPALKWIAESPVPLGLAHLNSRFGYNYQWFPIAAMMNVVGDVDHLSSFLLGGLLLWPFALITWEALTHRLASRPSRLFLGLSVISWVIIMFFSPKEITVFTPNMPAAVLAIMIVYATLRAIEVDEGWQYYLFITTFLAAFAVVIKISAAIFVLAPLVVLIYKTRKLHITRRDLFSLIRRQTIILLPLMVLMIVPWFIRGVFLSGCLVYPVASTCIPSFEWSVSRQTAIKETAGILVGGRASHYNNVSDVMASLQWIQRWWEDTIPQARAQAILAAAAFGIALWCLLLLTRRRRVLQGQSVFLVAAVVPTISIVFWFLTAPDINYGYGALLSMSMLLIASALSALQTAFPDFWPRLSGVAVRLVPLLVIFLCLWTSAKIGQAVLEKNRDILFNWPQVGSYPVQELHTASGDAVNVPDSGMCADNPRPCADNTDELHFTIKRDAQGNISEFVNDSTVQP